MIGSGSALLRPAGAAAARAGAALAGRSGSLEVRLAETAAEVRRAQRLRYRVFHEEMSATPGTLARRLRLDADQYDPICDHVVVLDHSVRPETCRTTAPEVVGTYRLLRREVAERHGGFYAAGEFAVEPLLARWPAANVLELGRSCVLAPYRTRPVLELLWHGVWAYALAHGVDVMIGCASLPGTDPGRLGRQLAYLHHHARSPEAWRVAARADRAAPVRLIPAELLDVRAAFRSLPPLVKGYLRLGATFGDGAVVDHAFGTTDVFVVLPVAAISRRYLGHFGQRAERYAS